jgi:molybdate transport repressor ModE-like protein
MALSRRVSDVAVFDLLLSVARTGSIGRAAAEHGISQPSASARLAHLERTVGLALLERTPRGSRLTGDGALVADWARTAVDAVAALDAGIIALRQRRDGRLRVAASMTIAEYLMPGWLVTLGSGPVGSTPPATVALTAGNSVEVTEWVLSAAADLGFIEGPDVSPAVAAADVGRDTLRVVVAATHPWARRRAIDAAELARTPLVSREEGSGTRAALELALATSGIHDFAAPLVELSSTTAIKAAVVAGMAPAVLSSLAVAADLDKGALVAVPVAGIDLRRRLRVIWAAGCGLTGPARDLYAVATASREGFPASKTA